MGSPYLNSGEVIVLTTNRVGSDNISFDVMLTSERIFLTDNRNARFEPRIVLLSSILSVQGGKTPSHDPVITILFRASAGGEDRPPLNLVFSQEHNENRKPERDDWLRSLIQLSIRCQEKVADPERTDVPPVPEKNGLHPAARHGVALEKLRPHSDVSDSPSVPAPVPVIPEDVEGAGEIPAPVTEQRPVEQERPEPAPVHDAPHHSPAPAARIIIPQIIEELLPEKKTPVVPETHETVPVEPIDTQALFRSVPAAVKTKAAREEGVPESTQTSRLPPETGSRDMPDIIRALRIGSTGQPAAGPVAAEEPEIPPEPVPVTGEPVPEISPAVPDMTEETRDISPVPDKAEKEPDTPPVPGEVFRREHAAAENIPVRHPIPPGREIRPLRATLVYAVVLLLVIALGAAAAILLMPQGTGPADSPTATLPQTPVRVTTIPAETVRPPTTIPTTTPVPSTLATTPVTVVPAPAIPQEGVWVLVQSTSYYAGTAGNPGFLQQVSGTGEHVYKVLKSDRPVQVSVQKQDNTGAVLAVSIYRDGTLVSTRSVTSPMGTVAMLIDPMTGEPPGISSGNASAESTGSVQLEDY